MEEKGKKDPSFIRQTIKGKPINKKSVLIGLLLVCLFAAVAAVIAAFVFVNMKPVAEQLSGKITPPPRVTIPVTEEPTPTPTPAETVTPTPTPEVTTEPDDPGTPVETTPEPVPPEPIPIVPADITMEQYVKLQNELTQIAQEANRAVVSVTAISSQMDYFHQSIENQQQISGVIVTKTDDAYYVLTESRILNNIERIQVTFIDGCIADAIFQKDDPDTGLAVVRVSTEDVPEETAEEIAIAPLGNSFLVNVGDVVAALGSPSGYSNSISFGRIISTDSVISAIDCEYNLLTTDIIGTADGSGILIDLSGAVVGIIDQSFCNSESQIVSGISISQLKNLIEQLSNGESRAYIGIRGSEVTASVSEITGIPKGILITEVIEESPAFFAGISEYDVITSVGEDKISNMSQYKNALAKLSPGDEITLLVLRKGAEGYTEITFTLDTGEI